jgi:hypothetical protein
MTAANVIPTNLARETRMRRDGFAHVLRII